MKGEDVKRAAGLLATLLVTAAITGAAPPRKDTIAILAISPEPPLKRGVPIELAVDVEADLQSSDAATAMIGFNTDNPVGFKMVDSHKLLSGAQRFTFVETVTPVDWGDRGDFTVVVHIRPESSGDSWRPTATARRILATEP